MFLFGANQTRGGLGRVCATGMYRSIEHVEFPKFQTGIFVEWKAPLVTSPTRFNSHQGHLQQRQNSCWTCGSKSHISRHCTKPTKPPNKKTPEVCRNFNNFTSAHCEQTNNKCSVRRLHKCSNCNKWGCKAVRHKESTASSLVAGLQSTDSPNNEIATGDQDTAIFGLPAVTNATGTLKEHHILWTPIVSAGEKCPLPLDSCCSVRQTQTDTFI